MSSVYSGYESKFHKFWEDTLNALPEGYENSLKLLFKGLNSIWEIEGTKIIWNYTDHGPKHIQRVFVKAHELIANAKMELSDDEWYVLSCGILLHDIGMQCDLKKQVEVHKAAIERFGRGLEFAFDKSSAYSETEQAFIRQKHNYISAAWIGQGTTEDTLLGQL